MMSSSAISSSNAEIATEGTIDLAEDLGSEWAYESESGEEDSMMSQNCGLELENCCGAVSLTNPGSQQVGPNGHNEVDLKSIEISLERTEIPSMSLVEGKLLVPAHVYLNQLEPVVVLNFGKDANRQQIIPLGHLGSKVVDCLASSIPEERFITAGVAKFIDLLSEYSVFDGRGMKYVLADFEGPNRHGQDTELNNFGGSGWFGLKWKSTWTAPCFDPEVHQVRTATLHDVPLSICPSWTRFSSCTRGPDRSLDSKHTLCVARITKQRQMPQTSQLLRLPVEIQQTIWAIACTSTSRIGLLKEDYHGPRSFLPQYVTGFYNRSHVARMVGTYLHTYNGPDNRELPVPEAWAEVEYKMTGTLRLVNRYLYCQLSEEESYKNNCKFFSSNGFTLSQEILDRWVGVLRKNQLLVLKDLELPLEKQYLYSKQFSNLDKLKGLRHLTLVDSMTLWHGTDCCSSKTLHKGCAEQIYIVFSGEVEDDDTEPTELPSLEGLESFQLRPTDDWKPELDTTLPASYKFYTTTVVLDPLTNNLVEKRVAHEVKKEKLIAEVREEYRVFSEKIKALLKQPRVALEGTLAVVSEI